MKLTFNDGHFVLLNASALPDHSWFSLGARSYSTTNLKAAVAFRRYADPIATKIISRVLNSRLDDVPKLPPLPFLDPHQIEGVKWILGRKRSYLAHAPGAGKTAQAIIAAHLIRDAGQTVLIVPPGLTTNWVREIWKFSETQNNSWPTVTVLPLSAKKESVNWNTDFIIVPDSLIAKDWVLKGLLYLTIKLLVVDEASRFKESTSKRALALFNRLTPKAGRVVLLDGSPMPNRPMELWAPTYALDPMSIDCMSQQDFGFKFCGAQMNERGAWEFKHASNEDELRARLQKTFMHVVSEAELTHPERLRSMAFINEDVRTPDMKTWERKHLSSLKEISEDASQGDMARYRQELGMRKVPFISRYVRDRLENTKESILLFVWHRDVATSLLSELEKYKPGFIIGGVSSEEREQAIADFQAQRSRLIIANISAAGRGHNLQKADRVIFGEFSWTDELNKQCEKRASRRGREQSAFVRCEYVVAPNSMDEIVLNSIFTKEQRVKRIIG